VRFAVERISPLGLGADVIIGFPGENEENFKNTQKLVEELPFSYLHVFPYSPRSGTEAYDLKNNVKNTTKKERGVILRNIVKKKSLLFRKSFIGKKVTVLIEDKKQNNSTLKGHSEHYIPVRINSEECAQNQLVSVLIKQVTEEEVVGCL
jgi:threonylcarbamoyladenosine tRNA methylthiotransferase MtaB